MSLSQYFRTASRNEVDLTSLNRVGNILNENIEEVNPPLDLPLEVKESKWKTLHDPERLARTYKFETYREVIYFFNELYKYQFKINHHCKITADGLNVRVVTYTHDFEGITNQDIKIKEYADKLYLDVDYLND